MLDNAALPATLNKATEQAATGSTAAKATITPAATGSQAYAVVISNQPGVSGAAIGNTQIDTFTDAVFNFYGTYVSTSTLTANTPFTAGSTANGTPQATAVLEVQPFGGTIATDASTPAAVSNNTTTATTAAFAPPPGSHLILALVSMQGGSGQASMVMSDSYGLTWTEAVVSNTAGEFYAGIWYAYTPASLSFTATAPPPAVTGTAYSYTLAAAGGYGTLSYAVATGALPAGLSLTGATGVISGTPTTPGLSTFTITATDSFGNTLTSGTVSMIVNQGIAGSGSIRQGWTDAAGPYFYGTKQVSVATTDHDWIFVSVSWEDGGDNGIAYVSDDAHNTYQPAAFAAGTVNTQVFAVPNAKPANTVYVSVSAYVRWLTICVLDVTGLQPGYTIDASNTYTGSAASVTESLSTVQPDFILAMAAFQGAPQTITQSGSGVTWNALSSAGINGSSSDGITQAGAWATSSSSASPSRQFTPAGSGNYSGCIVAVYKAGGLPVNSNPAWPVTKAYAAFGYTPNEPTVPPTWTDITSRYLGAQGRRGRSFELDEVSAADITVTFDNFDGGLSPGNPASPYYPNVTLITPVWITKTWQGRTYTVFRGIIHALPQTYDFQRTMVKMAVSDDFSKLPHILLPTCMIQEMLYDKPLDLWPLNEQQGAASAGNWSSRSAVTLTPVSASKGGGSAPATQQTITLFGKTFPVGTDPFSILASSASSGHGSSPAAAPTPTAPTTGFGNNNSGTYPAGLAGTRDSVWGNSSLTTTSTFFQGTVLTDSGDSTLPLTSTGATYSVWAQLYYVPSNTNATVITLTDSLGTAGTHVYLNLTYDGTHITAAQTTGSHNFTPPAYLFDSKWHLWTVTISTGAVVTVYLDGVSLGSYTATMPTGTPTLLQFGGDTTASTAATAGIFTGCMSTAGSYDRVVDPERFVTWCQSGATGFADELAGIRIQRVLAWARWSAPQAVDPGVTLQQPFSYLTGGYGSNGISGAVGNFNTAGGSTGIDNGAQSDSTLNDLASTDTGFLCMAADGTLVFRERDRMPSSPAALAMGDMDYALNAQQSFESGLGPWTSVSSCTVAQSAGWSYAGHHSALVTVTGTPTQAYAWGDKATVTPGDQMGFSCWVMSPQGCTVNAAIDFFNASSGYISTANTTGIAIPPMTPVFLNLTGVTAPALAASAFPHPTIVSSPATGTQLYFDRPRLSPAGFQAGYGDDVEIVEDIQYLYNDIAITRNVDQATYRARDAASRAKYYPRIYPRTIYSSVNDANAVVNCANTLLTAFSSPSLRVSRAVVDAAENPELWPFVLGTEIGDLISFTRTPVGGATVTGNFLVLSVEPDLGPDKARFTYVLAPSGVF